MNRYEVDFYSNDVPAIRKALERIANALEKNNKVSNELVDATTKDIPGFEGVLNDLDNLYQPTSSNPNPAGYANEASFAFAKALDKRLKEKETCNKDEYEYEHDLQGIRVDSDHDIRSTASFYEIEYIEKHGATKKECILDYVTNEFGALGARYTDIIKFAYYLGAHNAPKYDNSCRGYYAMAFNTRFGGHLVQGGKNQLVKGINKEGKERYFALSEVDNFTDYYKRIS